MEEHIDLFKKILTKIDDKVDYADIRAGKGNNTSIIMKDNQIQEINTGLSTVARIRVLNNGWSMGIRFYKRLFQIGRDK